MSRAERGVRSPSLVYFYVTAHQGGVFGPERCARCQKERCSGVRSGEGWQKSLFATVHQVGVSGAERGVRSHCYSFMPQSPGWGVRSGKVCQKSFLGFLLCHSSPGRGVRSGEGVSEVAVLCHSSPGRGVRSGEGCQKSFF